MSFAQRRPRSEQRARFSDPDRIVMAEDDLDAVDREFADVRREAAEESKKLRQEMEGVRGQLVWTNRILIGLLVTIAGGAVIGAYNVLITPP